MVAHVLGLTPIQWGPEWLELRNRPLYFLLEFPRRPHLNESPPNCAKSGNSRFTLTEAGGLKSIAPPPAESTSVGSSERGPCRASQVWL